MRRFLTAVACSGALALGASYVSDQALAQSGAQPNGGAYSGGTSQHSHQGGESERLTPEDFVHIAALSILFDIEAAELAAQRAQEPSVRDFASRLLADRRAALSDLRDSAGAVPTPGELDQENRLVIEALAKEQGAEFDAYFIGMMIDAHEDAIDLYEEFSATVEDASLEAFIASRTENLRSMLEEAQQIEDALEAAATSQR